MQCAYTAMGTSSPMPTFKTTQSKKLVRFKIGRIMVNLV